MENLTRTIDIAVANKDFATLQAVFSSNQGPNSWLNVGQGEQRSIAAHLIATAVADPSFLESTSLNAMMDVFVTALGHLPATVENAADNTLRRTLFEHLVSLEDYAGAARILAGMRMEDNGVYSMTAAEKTDIYVKIAECFLAEDEIAESDAAVNKAGVTVEQIPHKEQHTALILRYKSTYAQVLDKNRKFLAAASRYHELSQSATDLIDADDLLNLLGRAATCAILAPSGPQRQRVLGHIANDTRLTALDSLPAFATHSSILKKMYTHQVIRPGELTQFEASLVPHQKAVMGDGLTIMERGVVEHNMIAVANLYESIYVIELAHILGVPERKAESIAASMIMDGSLQGSIDQVEGLLEFETDETPTEACDRSVTSFCMELNRIAIEIKTNPAYAQ
jgi:COP9 signalosome complex subunit 4